MGKEGLNSLLLAICVCVCAYIYKMKKEGLNLYLLIKIYKDVYIRRDKGRTEFTLIDKKRVIYNFFFFYIYIYGK